MAQKVSTLKQIVKDKYAAIARNTQNQGNACCGGSNCCGDTGFTMINEDYTSLQGYEAEADMGLGCGLPTEYAGIQPGDIVLDLGSGAGNDCFVARELCGPEGWVIGVDMVAEMITRAEEIRDRYQYKNVEFRLGEIENMPVEDQSIDVVISNCVLNLLPDKSSAFAEIFRVLKPGGHLSVSDVVVKGNLPDEILNAAALYAGCVSGAMQRDAYLEAMQKSGLTNVRVQKERAIEIPDDILLNYLSEEAMEVFKASGSGIWSITVYAEKPA